MKVLGYAAHERGAKMKPVSFEREPLANGEVSIAISHCGVCHSDLHQVNDDWENTLWPCVPGHEIVGTVDEIGEGVTKFAIGDRVGVGCMVNSCRECEQCQAGDEQYCSGPKSCTLTYNGPKKPDGTNSYGGYSTGIIVREEFILRIPDAISSAEAAPILCAGVTTYQPMKHFGLKPGQTLGVAGVGGLGHMALQLGKALGARVVALTTTPEKAIQITSLGADDVIDMNDKDAVANAAASLDLMISTIPYPHDIQPYLDMMKPNTTLAVVGNIMAFESFDTAGMVFNRIAISGSLIGGISDTQEVLDLCAKHGIRPQIETIAMDDINKAFERLKNDDVRFRQVIDMATLTSRKEELAGANEIPSPARGAVVG